MRSNDMNLWLRDRSIEDLSRVWRVCGAVGSVVVWEERDAEFREGVDGRLFWDLGEGEEIDC